MEPAPPTRNSVRVACYHQPMACAICQTRRPKRFCPGVRGDICTICCGTEREMTVACPLECEFLRESRKHEQPQSLDPTAIPNPDIPVTEELLIENQALLTAIGGTLLHAALEPPTAVDFDVREALEALVRTSRTMQSGIYYETIPDNSIAARMCRAVRDGVEAFRKREVEESGISKTRDTTVLALLVFLQRFELDRNNGRRLGRAFLDALFQFYAAPPEASPPAASSLILP
jgi:hypothetical protein